MRKMGDQVSIYIKQTSLNSYNTQNLHRAWEYLYDTTLNDKWQNYLKNSEPNKKPFRAHHSVSLAHNEYLTQCTLVLFAFHV